MKKIIFLFGLLNCFFAHTAINTCEEYDVCASDSGKIKVFQVIHGGTVESGQNIMTLQTEHGEVSIVAPTFGIFSAMLSAGSNIEKGQTIGFIRFKLI